MSISVVYMDTSNEPGESEGEREREREREKYREIKHATLRG